MAAASALPCIFCQERQLGCVNILAACGRKALSLLGPRVLAHTEPGYAGSLPGP